MASDFKSGDLVWAKMKGFPPWPGKIVDPKPEVKRPVDKKPKHFIFFFGSENYAWVLEEFVWSYADNKEKYSAPNRQFRGFQEAIDAADEVAATMPAPPEMKKRARSPSPDEAVAKEKKEKRISLPTEKKKDSSLKDERKKSLGAFQSTKRLSSTPLLSGKKRLLEKEKEPIGKLDAASKYDFDSSFGSSHSAKKTSTAFEGTSGDYLNSVNSDPYLPDILPSLNETLSSKNIIATPMKIGFLGLGIMGSGMVDNLLRSGHEVTIWNRTTSKCYEFTKEGALKGNTPAEVVQSCDITFSCVTDPSALKDLVFGPSGVLQGISQGKGYVDMSTVDVETIVDVHEAITTRGGRFLEAPVIGNKLLSKNGQLIILAAGDQSLYDDCYSCFQAMSKHKFHLGEVGSATKMKLVLNILVGSTLAGLAESLALAAKVGLDTQDVMRILGHSTASSPFIREKGSDMINSRITEPSCKLQVMQKDLRLAINMSDGVDQPLHVSAAVNELFKKAKAKGYGEHDIAALYRAADL